MMQVDSAKLICLACYQDRLASVCENADGYKLFEIRDHKSYPAGLLSLPSKDPMDRTSAILACGVTIFLCGAIRNRTREALEEAGIQVIPWLTGSLGQVVDGYLHGSLAELAMPGASV
ncbi:dinitrogenase iron-molybdenum cofactor biosynthesis protein [Pseudodesulfovibrio indicus]|uniref:NifB/NifX family molybdenum-iron cluster-binding protein n=2 Tax=Pseudodesulfovibrio indicus TaxID=1716143 RepID=UPI0029318F3D|nr:dinitrogenase iron-molybdenum cofactor biosynthesis protein [Pseudodesulfovibrio indicus]